MHLDRIIVKINFFSHYNIHSISDLPHVFYYWHEIIKYPQNVRTSVPIDLLLGGMK